MRRGRAADAKDPAAIVAEHVPGSRDSHGMFNGTIEEFAEYLRTHNYQDKRYGPQRHTICNLLIDLTHRAGREWSPTTSRSIGSTSNPPATTSTSAADTSTAAS